MTGALAATAFIMGLLGSPHCAAMCGSACAALCRAAGAQPAQAQTITLHPRAGGSTVLPASSGAVFWLLLGRLAGYALAGALAAMAVGGLQWLSGQTAALRPAWTFFQALVFAWGLVLLAFARQPAWLGEKLHALGRHAGQWAQPALRQAGGQFLLGTAWTLLPCGLLYSALLMAGLSNGPLAGALTMALFALGSSLGLVLGPLLWQQLQRGRLSRHEAWGTRLAGLVLMGSACWSIWMQWGHDFLLWCGLA